MAVSGDKVTYIPYKGADKFLYQHGVVKRVESHGIFVVFNCNNEWEKYEDYTAQLCNEDNLRTGWL